MKKYVRPNSVSWWSGIGLLLVAVATSIIEKRIDYEGFVQATAIIGIRGAID